MNKNRSEGFGHLLVLILLLVVTLGVGAYFYIQSMNEDLLGTKSPTTVSFRRIDVPSSNSRNSSILTNLSRDRGVESFSILSTTNLGSIMNASQITLPLTPTNNMTLSKAKSSIGKYTKAKIWVSYTENHGGIKIPFILVQRNGSLIGGFQKNGAEYTIRKLNSREVVLIKNKKKILPRANDSLTSGLSNESPSQNRSGGFNWVDVLVTFPEDGLISFDEKNALAELFVGYTNEIITNTGLAGTTQLRLVGVVTDATTYESGNLENILVQLSGFGSDPNMFSSTRYYREYFGADIVVGMFPRKSASWNYYGIAFIYPYPEKAYAAVVYGGSDYSFEANIFAHEVGHLFGMEHQKALVPVHPVPEFQFGHGYQAMLGSECRSTILAYQSAGPLGSEDSPCGWFPIYSNPLKKSADVQIGDVFTANNASVLTSSAPRLSGFKISAFGGGPGGSCSSYGQSGCGGPCTSSCDCHNSSFSCIDIGGGAEQKECWNENICGGPAMAVRIQGVVRGCNNEPLPNIKVSAFGNTVTTNALGKYQIVKGNTGEIRETTIMAGADAVRGQTPPNSQMFFTSDYSTLINLTCATVNCLFTQRVSNGFGSLQAADKLLDWGPYRASYRIQKSDVMTDEYFVDNFVSTDNYAGMFDFKRVDCDPKAKVLDPHNVGVVRTIQKSNLDSYIVHVESTKFVDSDNMQRVVLYAKEIPGLSSISTLDCANTWFHVKDMNVNGPQVGNVQNWLALMNINNDARFQVGKKYLLVMNAESAGGRRCTGNPGTRYVQGFNLNYYDTCSTAHKNFCNTSRNPVAQEGMWVILDIR